jgi:hypothetical protein
VESGTVGHNCERGQPKDNLYILITVWPIQICSKTNVVCHYLELGHYTYTYKRITFIYKGGNVDKEIISIQEHY